jgi:glucokinase
MDTPAPAGSAPLPAPRPAPAPDAGALVLGLDVGGTKLATGVVRGDGAVLSRIVEPSRASEGPRAMIARHLDMGRRAVEASGVEWSSIAAVGIACGGPLDPLLGIIQSPLSLPGWDDLPLTTMVADALDRPAVVDNDATAGALAEWWFGAGRSRNVRSLVYLTISTGVGGGLVLDGRVYRGAALNAGELGHLTIDYRGRTCACGRRGCVEAYCSGTNIATRAREALLAGEPSSLGSAEPVTARDVAEHAASGDPLARRIWDETTEMLGSAVANILDAFNPELVVLGGGVTRAGAQLLDPVREIGLRLAMPPARATADVVLAELGDDLGIVSAAAVAFERIPEAGGRPLDGERIARPTAGADAAPQAGANARPNAGVGAGPDAGPRPAGIAAS